VIRRIVALGCVVAALTVTGGCGLPVQSSPQAIPVGELPLSLRQTTQTAPPITPRIHNAAPVFVYLLGADDQLIRVVRYLHPPPTPQKILDVLEAGPSPSELNLGIQSAIPPTADLVAGSLHRTREGHGRDSVPIGVLTVLLDSTFGLLQPGKATYEFAQIVYSVTSLPSVQGVLFEYNGSKIEPETGNGSIASNFVVNRADYRLLAP